MTGTIVGKNHIATVGFIGIGQIVHIEDKFENITTGVGDVMLMTSDKPELVEKIKAFAQKNREELKKWEEAKKAQE